MVFRDWAFITRVVDLIIPADDYPSAAEAGVADRLATAAAREHASLWRDLLDPGFHALAGELLRAGRDAGAAGSADTGAVDAANLETVLTRIAAGETALAWPVDPAEFHSELVRVVAEQYYGTHGSAAWKMVGYSPQPRRSSGIPLSSGIPPGHDAGQEPFPAVRLGEVDGSFDAVVIGLGAGGGVAAAELAQQGLRVLGVDRGDYLTYEQIGRDHLRNFRLSRYGHNTPPGLEAGPRLVTGGAGPDEVVAEPWDPRWSALPQTIGGGTRLYQGMAWRLLPADFSLASAYGVPAGSSLADWPMSYADLEPYYSEIEWRIGVSGDASSHRNQGRRSRAYPMKPLPDNTEAAVLRAAAGQLGWSTGPVPMLINSEPRDGRGRCAQCGQCVGFACPTDAKNGPYNTVLPAALRSGNLTVAASARATRITTDSRGRVSGVVLREATTGCQREITAAHVVVACSAIETPRLLLHSQSDAHPAGLGNATDQVGRHLQGHLYLSSFGVFDDPVIDGAGPNVRIATCDHIHAHPGILGGVLANEVLKLPVIHWNWALPPGTPRSGYPGKNAMRHLYRRTSHIIGPIQEIPAASNRVQLAPEFRDQDGVPAVRLSGRLHPDNARSADLLIASGQEWLAAAGARQVWSPPYTLELTAGQHQAGTCRMGPDPVSSVTDPWGRVHGHDNLWVADASLHVSNGGFNPVLTTMALALRTARYLATR